ncbi:uncharacterized protein CC84DRAFT_358379 [Paraphaeosphaeria sporulosa]|uniref:RING-type domain-containing protein n=1 Tax=Paraphaeosphaeria sporulosa TaxID=1460663 RepID=A0A177BXK8_9PLEO|nr:uncharacterized protein CC84DRAFT_358379 [Paraphaeosphaeria sporulosa]OAG00055.1 hypothetical protein CC84DRAFT_358379 [Paraphaeosphaeria sporulosa]
MIAAFPSIRHRDASFSTPDQSQGRKTVNTTGLVISMAISLGFIVFLFTLGWWLGRFRQQDGKPQSRLSNLNAAVPRMTFKTWYKQDVAHRNDGGEAAVKEQVCVICLEGIRPEDDVRALHCGHCYHGECFDRWYLSSRGFCPLCNRSVFSAGRAATM